MNNELLNYLSSYLAFSLDKDSANEAASTLIQKYGSLAVMSSSSVRELSTLSGMNESAALSLKLLSYIHGRSITDKFKKRDRYQECEIRSLIKAQFEGLSVETVYCLLFDKDGRLIGTEYLGEGTVNSSEIYPRKVLECACRKQADGVIIAHNHPKGDATASATDLTGTGFLRSVLSSGGIRLLGHYLVSDTECVNIDTESFG